MLNWVLTLIFFSSQMYALVEFGRILSWVRKLLLQFTRSNVLSLIGCCNTTTLSTTSMDLWSITSIHLEQVWQSFRPTWQKSSSVAPLRRTSTPTCLVSSCKSILSGKLESFWGFWWRKKVPLLHSLPSCLWLENKAVKLLCKHFEKLSLLLNSLAILSLDLLDEISF